MNIKVSEIPEEGLSIEGVAEFPHPFQDAAWTLESVSLLVEKDGSDVLVRGRMRARVPQTCGRCLEPFPFAVLAQVDTRFCPRPARGEEVELTPDDLEVDFYAADLLDVDRLLQTETELGLPMKPLCRPDCRGLCAVCGGNRNVAPCTCEVRQPDPRLAALKELADRLRPSARTTAR
jgi:uncharacterized protein